MKDKKNNNTKEDRAKHYKIYSEKDLYKKINEIKFRKSLEKLNSFYIQRK